MLDQFVSDLIRETVAETIRQQQASGSEIPADGLCYTEEQAATLLSVKPHVLRDMRRRGEITYTRVANDRVRYTREDLTTYLDSQRGRPSKKGKSSRLNTEATKEVKKKAAGQSSPLPAAQRPEMPIW